MKRLFYISLAIVLIVQTFSISAFCVVSDNTCDNEVGYYSDRISVTITKQYTQNLHVFTIEDFPGLEIEKIEQSPAVLVRNEDGTIGLIPDSGMSETDIEAVRTTLIVYFKDEGIDAIFKKINIIVQNYEFVQSARPLYINSETDGHSHLPSALFHICDIVYPGTDKCATDWFSYCLICGKSLGRERYADDNVLPYGRICIHFKSKDASANASYSAKDFVGIEVESVENMDGHYAIIHLKTTNKTDGQNALNSIRQLDFVEKAYFYSYATLAGTYPAGDVNLDRKVDVNDARETLRRSIGLEAECYNLNADIDNDGKITVADARLVLRIAIHLDNNTDASTPVVLTESEAKVGNIISIGKWIEGSNVSEVGSEPLTLLISSSEQYPELLGILGPVNPRFAEQISALYDDAFFKNNVLIVCFSNMNYEAYTQSVSSIVRNGSTITVNIAVETPPSDVSLSCVTGGDIIFVEISRDYPIDEIATVNSVITSVEPRVTE